ncbi:DUF5693 family protein [Desulfallas thermosapovorans]|uniref:Uncharacterized protein n=1 Tax=Desulfallas thermosapovorans DSM 6562 TaxID=1121431 RepID=A0A5S4ZQA7_9FIRM|nr:DUF5693 family protein [Desulfallas thermosapovorans]TYO94791.1 hypothetical protein LX24_02042 [Desulfallas thermosapovorans DSM 6562]
MNEKSWKLLLIGVIFVSMVAAGYAAWQRLALERDHRGVELAVVYDEVAALARMKGIGTAEALDQFRDQGVTTVLVKEPTVQEAAQNAEFIMRTGQELLVGAGPGLTQLWGENYREEIDPGQRYFIFTSERTYQRVRGQLEAKGVQVNAPDHWQKPGLYVFGASYHWGFLEQMGVGYSEEAWQQIREAGLQTMVQLRTWNQVTPAGLDYVFEDIARAPNLSAIAFNDPQLPGVGDPELTRQISYHIKDLGVPAVQIEFFNQKGMSSLGLLLDKQVIRLHSLSLEEYAKRNFSITEMVDRFSLAATERNIRVLLLHSYMKPDEPDMLQFNLQLVDETRDRLLAEGMHIEEASTLEPLPVSRGLLFVIGLGVIAGGMLLLMVMGLTGLVPYIGLAGLLCWAGLLAVDFTGPARKLMAFGAVVVFPTLSLAVNLKPGPAGLKPASRQWPGRQVRWESGRRPSTWPEPSRLGHSIVLLLRTSLYSLVGALLMVGLLADIGFMLKLDQFTGVKLAHVIPLALLAGIFFFRSRERDAGWQEQLSRFMDQPILVKFAVAAGVLLVVLLVYVSRTGNESAAVSSLELQFRTMLDNLLGVRPRTKEFMFGHPLLLLLFYLGYRDNRYMPLLLGGAIGQISLVNTYAHIHTPLVVSLLRSFHGLWLGIIGGLVLIVIWLIGERLYEKYLRAGAKA